MEIDDKVVDINTIEFTDVIAADYPDFTDVSVSYALFVDGEKLNHHQLIDLRHDYPHEINRMVLESYWE